jgi:CRISPR-associated protein Csx10
MLALAYKLLLEQAVLATAPGGDPNSSVSLAYIPGSLIRGALIGRYLAQDSQRSLARHPKGDGEQNAGWRRFLSGNVRYLHAYPLERDGQRMLPTPRSWHTLKHIAEANIYDAAAYRADARWRERVEERYGSQLEQVDDPFVWASGGGYDLRAPLRSVAVHIQRERASGRPNEGDGELFQYNALLQGQWFGGAIVFDDAPESDDDLRAIRALLADGPYWLGRSRSAEYGRARFAVDQPEGEEHDWWEGGRAPEALPVGRTVLLTLLSDTLVRDATGQWAKTVTAPLLARWLGGAEDGGAWAALAFDEGRSFTATTRIGGFNRTWQLPLPQAEALAAGSVIAFTPAAEIPRGEVERLLREGIGERRAEGFGRVAFDWSDRAEYRYRPWRDYAPPRSTPAALAGTGRTIAQTVAKRLDASQREEWLHGVARTLAEGVRAEQLGRINPRQLRRLAGIVRAALPSGDTRAVARAFEDFKAVAGRQFAAVRLEASRANPRGTPLDEWIATLLREPTAIFSRLGLPRAREVLGVAPTPEARADEKLALRLLAALLGQLEERQG